MTAPVRVIPLGGLGEVGKNIMAIEQGDDMVLIDVGLTFPREEGMFGVDIVLPDFTYVKNNAHKLRAVLLTHGHEDHIGALAYLMRQVDVPAVYGTRFTLALVKAKVDEHGLINSTEWIEIVPEQDPFEVGPFEVEAVRMSHSIPDCVALALHTSEGTILHSADFKVDSTPLDGVPTDLGHLAELGADGVDLYLGDSTNADVPGHNPSERSISGPLRDIIFRADRRVIACCFSSHIHRLQQLCDIALESGRSVAIVGRSMTRNTNIARNLGYMDIEGVSLIKPARLGDEEIDHDRLMILCTGSQGEPLAALSRIAWGSHPTIKAHPDDTVIFSSRTIPGNEVRVHAIINQLSKIGCRIYHQENARVHVSGHACSEELKTVLQLVRPTTFMPVHGEWRHLRAHADIARMLGQAEDRIILGENGCVVELKKGVARLSEETVHVGADLVDRHNDEQIVETVMDERQQLSGDGLLVAIAHLHDADGTRLQLIPRGFSEGGEDALAEAREAAEESLRELLGHHLEPGQLQAQLQQSIEGVIYDRTRRNPLVVPVIVDD